MKLQIKKIECIEKYINKRKKELELMRSTTQVHNSGDLQGLSKKIKYQFNK